MFSRAIRSTLSQPNRLRHVSAAAGPSGVRFNSSSSQKPASLSSLGRMMEDYAKTAKVVQPASSPRGPPPDTHLDDLTRRKFIKPSDLGFEARTVTPHPRKRPLLGPSAKESKYRDVFYQLNIDPLHEAFNSKLLSRFVSEMGKIKGRAETNLTWKSQRRLGKAIRRAKQMGIIPILSKRPLDGVKEDGKAKGGYQ
ncbi:unnamed protein product [Somion occarium]|uniref:Small ribosomal subunit protein bS18m n=1 Tax=Somion occarium TaxID=3059160 RepID=A0ABP1CZ26_9APHY